MKNKKSIHRPDNNTTNSVRTSRAHEKQQKKK